MALTIIFMSTGYFLIVFIIVMPPAMILHFMAWYRGIKGHPETYVWIILSSTIFLVFSLLRLDKDAHGVYNGYQTVLYYLGKIESPHGEPLAYSLEISLTLLLSVIILDAITLRKAVRK
jgi:hypothetical protein